MIVRSLGLAQRLDGMTATRGCWLISGSLFLLSSLAVGFATAQGADPVRLIVTQSLVDGVADLGLLGLYFGGLLRWRGLPGVSSVFLMLTVAVLGVLGFVLAAFWWLADVLHLPTDAVTGGYAAAILLLFMWNVMAVGQLARQALNLSALMGLLVSLGYFILSGVLIAALNLWLWPGQA
ncbi:hypothetical protein [Halothiobacillus sp. DCM-1]|uniref:hypothetical protein n=1 Tax=Halothiobacillus sp. DCM-1 TaxID=3112558 RepID=UPI00325208B4